MASGINAIERQSWSDLPRDIINLIANRLYYADQKQFRKVCKSWQAADIVKYADKLPWKMGWNSGSSNLNDSSCYLYAPSHKQTYTVFNNRTAARRNKFAEKFNGAAFIDSRQDWVLFSNKVRRDPSTIRKINLLFFYTPFTGEIIELPETDNHNVKIKASFSATPVSPECVVFDFHIVQMGNNCIRMCKPGDKTWTKLWIEGDFIHLEDIKYMDGVFYCLLHPRSIGAFTVASGEWKLLPYPRIEIDRKALYEKFVECDGHHLLMSMMIHRFGHYNCQDHCRWHVYRFDQSELEWFELEDRSLDDKALLLSRSSSSILISVDKGSELARRVYGFHGNCYFDCSCSCRWISVSPEKHSSRSAIYDDCTWDFYCFKEDIWIQLPQPKQCMP